ncbi:hypothetical protein Taro_040353 [Colocasia esculenta]|uniref:Major facilitator superfamily (MFS) profile domain-containing protein n=1 Tax=Colocasia esculenta TaxID=4460 RepID=A0A843WLN0_COLES|nr:hypothetical protein [Colocasia esculenta]
MHGRGAGNKDGESTPAGATARRGDGKSCRYALACAIIASTISILLGYGVMSGAMLFIKEDLKITEVQVEVLAGILNLCAMVGAAAGARISDWVGRRWTIMIAAVIFFLGALLMGLAPRYAMLLAGRCVAGVGVGCALMIAPVYAAEVSSPSSRGFLTSLPEVCISLGILLGYVANYFLAGLPLIYGWRSMLGLAAVPSLMLVAGVLKMPESPRWLVMQGRVDEARDVLFKVSNTEEEAKLRLCEIEAAVADAAAAGTRGEGVWKELLVRPSPAVRRILVAAVGIHFFEHATGIEAVVLYTPRILKKAGLQGRKPLLGATMGVGATKTCFILVATFLLDRVGRRPLLLTSLVGMILALSGLGFGLTAAEKSGGEFPTWAVALCIAMILTFVASFSVGLGPITWVYSSEIFPLRLRAQGVGLGVAVNRVMNATVSMSFISLYEAITIGGAFFMFAGIGVVAWIFFYLMCPETKGRSLEEMEQIFDKRRGGAGISSGTDVEMGRKQ